ncbi:MAG: biosynthetic arginine decarboxylase [Acidobacteria bacterium]|uniref:Arginine decarboxylase n=1 Tax=Candidatus Polarisedimenticola svalbardensis TaxID=2886004 RepID=A0A8J6XRQ0_9BACT|nr:biosynthetic arginine decarboxylase [Candidatus Polarisedimenticola svalbardensis]
MGKSKLAKTDRYTVEHSRSTYRLNAWGQGYFKVLADGHLAVQPGDEAGGSIDIFNAVQHLRSEGFRTPVLLRFPQLLEAQVRSLVGAFRRAAKEFDYPEPYLPVYPVKVNQQSSVVRGLLEYGRQYGLGLEAGSSAELLGAIGLDIPRGSLLICNGYKDPDYLGTAAMAARLGRNVIVVVEKPFEVDQILEGAPDWDTVPGIGLRVKLQARGSGLWEKSGGFTSKFGLTTLQLIQEISRLKSAGLGEKISLLHFHIGSQITQIRKIKTAVREAARVYAKLRKAGVAIRYLDVGGGLGIDYDGSRTSADGSVNYGIQEYANDVVFGIHEICDEEEVPYPVIVSESGRMLTGYHSILVTDVRGSLSGTDTVKVRLDPEPPQVITNLMEIEEGITVKNYREYYHDALEYRDQMYSLFDHGMLELADKADGETLFWSIADKAMAYARRARYLPEEFSDLKTRLRKKYICNLSVFQSLPDHFALDQLFPVVPVHRLDEEPTALASLVDITCDSDGEVDKFIDLRDIKDALELHELIPGKQYYIGFLLVGAYQDTMGCHHNLFGRVHEAEVLLAEDGSTVFRNLRPGHVARETLGIFGHDPATLTTGVDRILEEMERNGDLAGGERDSILEDYTSRLERYTYLGESVRETS